MKKLSSGAILPFNLIYQFQIHESHFMNWIKETKFVNGHPSKANSKSCCKCTKNFNYILFVKNLSAKS